MEMLFSLYFCDIVSQCFCLFVINQFRIKIVDSVVGRCLRVNGGKQRQRQTAGSWTKAHCNVILNVVVVMWIMAVSVMT